MHFEFLTGKSRKVKSFCKVQPCVVKRAGFVPLLDDKLWTYRKVQYFYCVLKGDVSDLCLSSWSRALPEQLGWLEAPRRRWRRREVGCTGAAGLVRFVGVTSPVNYTAESVSLFLSHLLALFFMGCQPVNVLLYCMKRTRETFVPLGFCRVELRSGGSAQIPVLAGEHNSTTGRRILG